MRRQRLEQAVGVGVRRLGQHLLGVALLDAAAGVHDDDVVRGLGDDREVVRDEDDRRAEILLQVVDEVEDLRLDGDVEAVVGSSAMSTLGLLTRPSAIMARWRIPPENSWGYWLALRWGFGMPTRSSISTARLCATLLLTLWWWAR